VLGAVVLSSSPRRSSIRVRAVGSSASLFSIMPPVGEGKASSSVEDKVMEKNDDAGEEKVDEAEIKLILLGDSAVGKTKMVERFLMDEHDESGVHC
jgi:Rab-like protein 2